MNALVLTSYRPHRPASGGALRNWQNICALAGLGSVDVVSVGVDDAAEAVDGVETWVPFPRTGRTAMDRMRSRCWPLRPGVHPGFDGNNFDAVRQWLNRRARHRPYDIAVLESLSTACYLPDVKRVARRVVFDAHNVETALQDAALAAASGPPQRPVRRFKNWVLASRIAEAERRAVAGADLVWTCSADDTRALASASGRLSGFTIVPNGVDVHAYRRPGVVAAGGDWSAVPITLLYAGLFTFPPNEDAAIRLITEVLPAVRARGCRARAVLVGQNPTAAMRAAAERDADVDITGSVDSVLPYLERPCIVTLPIAMGSGTRLKIVEAFAVGRPVVSSRKGAEGLAAIDGEHLLLRDDPASMAAAVVELWQQPSRREALCARALDLVCGHYSWHVAARRIEQSLGLRPAMPRAIAAVASFPA